MNKGAVHFIAIGGSVMHNLALALHNQGFIVSGSDDHIYEPAFSRLQKAGICPPVEGWFPEKVNKNLQFVILGMHAREDNPELQKALRENIPVFSFPEFIARVYENQFRIVIAGSHGKTTTTSMLMQVLKASGQSFDYLVGAQLEGFGEMVSLSGGKYAVIEGDEYLSSCLDRKPKFLHYRPAVTVITGIAWDHYNVFPRYEDYIDAFMQLILSMPEGGHLIYFGGDEALCQLVGESAAHLHCIPYREALHVLRDQRAYLMSDSACHGLSIFGRHNLQNLQAVREVCHLLKLDDQDVCLALSEFKGAARRLELIFSGTHKKVYQDFAHAPSKVRATVQAVHETFSGKRILCYLELNTYSSLNPDFVPQYEGSLSLCERAVVYFDRKAVEIKRMQPMTADFLRNSFRRTDLSVIDDPLELKTDIQAHQDEYDVILMLGSGNWGGLRLAEIFDNNVDITP